MDFPGEQAWNSDTLWPGDSTASETVPVRGWHTEAMSGSRNVVLQAKIVTASDGVVAGTRQDASGEALEKHLVAAGWDVVARRQIADGIETVRDTLVELADGFCGLIVTTGGTGFGPRDLTPEGTRQAIEREAPGLAEAMRLCNEAGLGRLSRAIAGTRGRVLILNTPGSTKGAIETLDAVLDVAPHAIELLAGERPH